MALSPNFTSQIRLWTGTDGDDVFYGDARRDFMYGRGGDDVLDGGAGDDVLRGEAGDDALQGGAGADALDGGDGSDWAIYYKSDAAIAIDLSTGAASGGHAQGDTLSGIENIWATRYADALTGSHVANTIKAGAGNDTVHGLGGNDIIRGEDGNDTIDGGGHDDTINGGFGNDTIRGGSGNDRLEGFLGDDVLTASLPNQLNPLNETDTFVFADYHGAGFGHDRITDFDSFRDKLDVRALDIGFADVDVTQINGGTLIGFDGVEGNVFLSGVSAATIGASDFVF